MVPCLALSAVSSSSSPAAPLPPSIPASPEQPDADDSDSDSDREDVRCAEVIATEVPPELRTCPQAINALLLAVAHLCFVEAPSELRGTCLLLQDIASFLKKVFLPHPDFVWKLSRQACMQVVQHYKPHNSVLPKALKDIFNITKKTDAQVGSVPIGVTSKEDDD